MIKRYAFLLVCCVLCFFPVSTDGAAKPGLFRADAYTVGLWLLNGDATDESSYSNDGTLNDGTSTTGRFGTAYSFDGVHDGITVDDAASISGLSAVTIEAWIYVTDWSANYGYRIIIGKSNYTNNREYRIRIELGTYLRWHVSADGNDPGSAECSVIASTVASENAWHYIAGTYDSDTDILYLYVDGEEVDNASYSSSGLYDGTAKFGIGAYGNLQTDEGFVGIIDSVRLSNIARSAEDIKKYYQSVSGTIID